MSLLWVSAACWNVSSAATQAYVTDKLEIQMRSGQSLQHKIIEQLPSGTPVKVLQQNSQSGYSLVELNDGERGWVLTRYLSSEPVGQLLVDELTRKLTATSEENRQLKAELSGVRSGKEKAESSTQSLQSENSRLASEVIAIRQTAASALQIQTERDQLQERVINLEREVESLNRAKQALTADYRQSWFLIGAGVLLGGIALGLVLPRLSWRKRSSWDSF